MELRRYQREAIEAVETSWNEGINRPAVVLPTGCHRSGQGVLMFDGSIKAVEDIVVGDRLMGPDSTPRTVLRLARGTGPMMTVVPVKGQPWVVNNEHVLSLAPTGSGRYGTSIVDVSVKDYLTWNRTAKHTHKLFRVGVDFPTIEAPNLDPYFVGIVIGDGSTSQKSAVAVTTVDPEVAEHVKAVAEQHGLRIRRGGRSKNHDGITHHITSGVAASRAMGRKGGSNPILSELQRLGLIPIACGDKFVPDVYKLGSRHVRLEVLAGLLDSDGHMSKSGFEFGTKSETLAHDVAFIARSLGLAAYVAVRGHGVAKGHFRVSINGECSMIPNRVARQKSPARAQKKNVLKTGFRVEPTGTVEPFYGFTLDGDQRYVLDDFTVTHNSGKTVVFSHIITRHLSKLRADGKRVLVLAHREELLDQAEAKIKAVDPRVATVILRGSKGWKAQQFADVIVASVQTLSRPRRRESLRDVGMVIVDECHRYAAPSYLEVLRYYGCMDDRRTPTVGLTATLTRMSGGLPDVWQSVAYSVGIHEMISTGYLVPPVAKSVAVPRLSLADARVTGGDLNAGDVADAMIESEAFGVIVDHWNELASDRPTIAFMPNVETTRLLTDAFRAHGVAAEMSVGETTTEERAGVYRRFADGSTRVLVSCMTLTEGFDAPHTSCVIVGRPTLNPGLYIQMIGRGLRLSTGKTDCLVLDVAGASLKHKLSGVNDLESDCAADCGCGCLACGCATRCKCGTRKCGCDCVDQHVAPGSAGPEAVPEELAGGVTGPGGKTADLSALNSLVDVDVLGRELRKSRMLWLTTDGGINYLPVGASEAVFLLPVPNAPGQYFQGKIEGSGRNTKVSRLDSGPVDAASARQSLEEYAQGTGYAYVNKRASWRRSPATQAQLDLLARMGVAVPGALKKGEASDLLSGVRFTRSIDPWMRGHGYL